MKKETGTDNSAARSKQEKLEINKQIKKLKREEQLKSGVKLTTKVIPDKKKYVRKKNVIPKENDE